MIKSRPLRASTVLTTKFKKFIHLSKDILLTSTYLCARIQGSQCQYWFSNNHRLTLRARDSGAYVRRGSSWLSHVQNSCNYPMFTTHAIACHATSPSFHEKGLQAPVSWGHDTLPHRPDNHNLKCIDLETLKGKRTNDHDFQIENYILHDSLQEDWTQPPKIGESQPP